MGFKLKKRTSFNPKRKIQDAAVCTNMPIQQLGYGGNPEHKRNPGDFGLTPPADPRPHKSLCDDANITTRKDAKALLVKGFQKGLVSQKASESGWPQNVWAVTESGIPLEAQLENAQMGTYHGYPMPDQDPLARMVLDEWSKRDA